jgi:tRNA (guanosine-2'-O-)-methyltransferase
MTLDAEQIGKRPRAEARYAAYDPHALAACLTKYVQPARQQRLHDVFDARVGSVTVLMDAPYDPHNGGAVVRTLDAFGVPDLHVVERQVAFLAATHVARGAHKWVDVHTYETVTSAVDRLVGEGYELVATHPEGELLPQDLSDSVRLPKICLVLGNERDGIAAELDAACTRRVKVPMRGFVESLNVSVTGAILLQRALEGRVGDLSAERRAWLFVRGLLASHPRAEEFLAIDGFLPAAEPAEADEACQDAGSAQRSGAPVKPEAPSLSTRAARRLRKMS